MKNENAIEIQGLSKVYRLGKINSTTLQEELLNIGKNKQRKEFLALDNINLEVKKGETLGIIGYNGAGKSTLLKILSNITAPTSGKVYIRGRVSSMLEVGTGFHRDMTGRENIYMKGAILGMKRSEIDEVVEDIINFSEIREFIDTPVKRYSSGMNVKLAFSVAIHLNNEIIVMDEVLAVGDLNFQNKCIEKIKEIASDTSKTILLVSHNLNLVRQLADRVLFLDKGKIAYLGDTETAISSYMNQVIATNSLHRNLKEISHSANSDKEIEIITMDILNKDSLIYKNDETLDFKLTVNSLKETSLAILRITLRNESDVGLGSAFARELKLNKGLNTLSYSLSLKDLEKGIFYVSLGLYEEDSRSKTIVHDHITHLFRFEVTSNNIWNVHAHGYFKLDLKEICDEK